MKLTKICCDRVVHQDGIKFHSTRPAFERVDDLLHVKGTGTSAVMNLKPFVTIEPATQPATQAHYVTIARSALTGI